MNRERGCASGGPIRGYRERARTRSLLPVFDSRSEVASRLKEDPSWLAKRNSFDACRTLVHDEGEGTVIKLCGVSLGSRPESPEPYPISRCHTLPRRAPGGLQLQPVTLVSESAPASPRLRQEETQEPPGAPPRPPAPSFYQWCHTFARSREATKVANHSPTALATPWGTPGTPLRTTSCGLGAAVPRPYTGNMALKEAIPNARTPPAGSSRVDSPSDAQEHLVGPLVGGREAPGVTGAMEDPPVWLRVLEAPLPQPPVRTSSKMVPPTIAIGNPLLAKDCRDRLSGAPQEAPAVADRVWGSSPSVPGETTHTAGEGNLSQTVSGATDVALSERGSPQTDTDPSHSQRETPQITNATAKPFCREGRPDPCCELTPASEPLQDKAPLTLPLRRRGSRRPPGASVGVGRSRSERPEVTGAPRAEDILSQGTPPQAATPPADRVASEPPQGTATDRIGESAVNEGHSRARQSATIDEIFRDLIEAVSATGDSLPGGGLVDSTQVPSCRYPKGPSLAVSGSDLALTPHHSVPPHAQEVAESQVFQSAVSLCSDALLLQQESIPVCDEKELDPEDVGRSQRLYGTPDGAEEGPSAGAPRCVREDAGNDATSREGAEGDVVSPAAGGPGVAPRVASGRPAFLVSQQDAERRPTSMRFPLDVIRGRHLRRDGEPSRSPKQRLSVDQVRCPGLAQGSYKSKSASRIGTEGGSSASDAVETCSKSHVLPLDTTLEDRIRMTIDSFADGREDGRSMESQEEPEESPDGDLDEIRVRGVVSPRGFCLDVIKDSREGPAGVKGVPQHSEDRGIPGSHQDSPGRTCLLQECTNLPYIDECDHKETEETPGPSVDSLGLQQRTRVSCESTGNEEDSERRGNSTIQQPVCVVLDSTSAPPSGESDAQGVSLGKEEPLGEPATQEPGQGFDHSSSSLATVISVESREEEEEEDSFVDAYDSMDRSAHSSGSPGLAVPQDVGPQSSESSTSSEAWWTSGAPAGVDLPPLDSEEGRASSLEEEEESPDYENDFDAVDADMRRLEEKLRVFERELKEQPDEGVTSNPMSEDPLPILVASQPIAKTKHLSLMTRLEVREYDGSASASGESDPASSSDSADFLFVRTRAKPRPGERKCRSLEERRRSDASRDGGRRVTERREERLDLSSLNVPVETPEEKEPSLPAEETLSKRSSPVKEHCEELLNLGSLNVPMETIVEKEPSLLAQETLSRRSSLVKENYEELLNLDMLNVPVETLEKEPSLPTQETLSNRSSPVKEDCEDLLDLGSLKVPLEKEINQSLAAQESPARELCEECLNVPLEEEERSEKPAQEVLLTTVNDPGKVPLPQEEDVSSSMLCSGEEEDVLQGCIWREEDGMASVDFEGLEDFRSFEGQGALMIMFEDDLEDEPQDEEEEEEVPSQTSSECLVDSGWSRGPSVASSGSSSRSFLTAFKDGLRRASKYLGRRDEGESQLANRRGRRLHDEGAAGVYNVQSGRVAPASFVPSSDSEGPEVFSCSSGEYYAAPAICVNTSDEERMPLLTSCDEGLQPQDLAQSRSPAVAVGSPPAPPPRWVQRRSYISYDSYVAQAYPVLSQHLSAHALANGRDAHLCLLADPAAAGWGVPPAGEQPPPPPACEFDDRGAIRPFESDASPHNAKVRLRQAEGGSKGVPRARGRPPEDPRDVGHRRSWPLRVSSVTPSPRSLPDLRSLPPAGRLCPTSPPNPPHGVPSHSVPPHGMPPHSVPPHGVPPHSPADSLISLGEEPWTDTPGSLTYSSSSSSAGSYPYWTPLACPPAGTAPIEGDPSARALPFSAPTSATASTSLHLPSNSCPLIVFASQIDLRTLPQQVERSLKYSASESDLDSG